MSKSVTQVRLAKVNHIFLTRMAWELVGGLPGMLLSLADIGQLRLNLHGPANLVLCFYCLCHFFFWTVPAH